MSAIYVPSEWSSFSSFVNAFSVSNWFLDDSKKIVLEPDGSKKFAFIKKG
jgi:hypothetical protein